AVDNPRRMFGSITSTGKALTPCWRKRYHRAIGVVVSKFLDKRGSMTRRYGVVCFFLLLTQLMMAQEFRGTITGRVTDAQKAAIPNAKISATLLATGSKSETTTGVDGLYTIPFLAPGEYRVEAEATGFKRYVRGGMNVSAGERIGLDVELSIGAVSESINVTAEAPLLETTTASAGQVIGSA